MGQEVLDYTSGNLTGVIDLATTLNPNQANQLVTATAYNFSENGLLSYSPGPQPFGLFDQQQTFVFSTSNGQITSWLLDVSAQASPGGITGYGVNFTSSTAGDMFEETAYTTLGPIAFPVVVSAPGSWIDPPSAKSTLTAPEMDWTHALTAVLLLCGMGLVIKDARRV
jgi:hypothetical protein